MNAGGADVRRGEKATCIGVATACLLLTGAAIAWMSPLALLYVLTDGVLALGVFAAVTGAGLWIIPALGLGRANKSTQALLAAALGTGATALLILLAGRAGMLNRSLWIGFVAICAAAGLARVAMFARSGASRTSTDRASAPQPGREPAPAGRRDWAPWLWLLVVPTAALAILAASTPPGFLWSEEARGYDVLEYHLAVPKEYFQSGAVRYLPHNVYSAFPKNAEMHYLLAMILKGNVPEALLPGKYFNLLFGVLFAASAWWAGAAIDRSTGRAAGILAASTPWLMYLSGVAYVENGMLFFAMMSFGALARLYHALSERKPAWPWALIAGWCAGFACGFKYTAAPMVAVPAAAAALLIVMMDRPRRWALFGIFALAAATTFAPWLATNFRDTGNPVFPLAYGVFGARDDIWTQPMADRWARGHQPEEGLRGPVARMGAAWHRLFAEPRIGIPLWILAMAGALRRRRDILDWVCWGILAIQLGVWLFATHLFARFAVPMLVPLVFLAARAVQSNARRPAIVRLSWAGIAAAALINTLVSGRMYFAETLSGGRYVDICGRTDLMYGENTTDDDSFYAYINKYLPVDAKLLMVGEARSLYIDRRVDYCVVFSPNPLTRAVESAKNDDQIIEWLKDRGYTYLYVGISEMQRLRRTYGFDDALTPALFERLAAHGLKRLKSFSAGPGLEPYGALYLVER